LRYARVTGARHRFVGNLAIAVGALLPGIGGSATRFGHTEVLYVTELIGLVLIWIGYRTITKGVEAQPVSHHATIPEWPHIGHDTSSGRP
jgi:hypothetical protein